MSSNPVTLAAVEYAGVQFSVDGVSSVYNRRPTLKFLKNDIRKIVLRTGFQAERPAVQIGLGLGLAIVWLIPFANFLRWLNQGGGIYDLTLLVLWLIIPAIWMTIDGLRRGPYLEVTLDEDRRKLPFTRAATPDGLENFLRAGTKWGYSIERQAR